jgi:hypothetical protein
MLTVILGSPPTERSQFAHAVRRWRVDRRHRDHGQGRELERLASTIRLRPARVLEPPESQRGVVAPQHRAALDLPLPPPTPAERAPPFAVAHAIAGPCACEAAELAETLRLASADDRHLSLC